MINPVILAEGETELLAVDPGGLSGIVRGKCPTPGEYEPLDWWELEQQATCDLIVDWCSLLHIRNGPRPPAILIIEKFWPTGGARNFQPYSLEIIGVARWACKRSGIPMVMQNASDMKAHSRADAVKLHPLIGRGGKGHAKDALGHMHLFA